MKFWLQLVFITVIGTIIITESCKGEIAKGLLYYTCVYRIEIGALFEIGAFLYATF